ncbi:MAG: hypothetical protein AB7S54_09125 [Bacteroidales bacterium]
MNTSDHKVYLVQFENMTYSIPVQLVRDLLKISENEGSNQNLVIRLKDNKEIKGNVIDYVYYNTLYAEDINVPVSFRIKSNEKIEEITFLEVVSIELQNN